MFGKERIPILESEIAREAGKLRQARLRAAALADYGLQQARMIPDYYEPQILSAYQHLRAAVAKMPADFVAGWDETSRWRDWEPTELHEESWLRMGDVVEKSPSNRVLIPAFFPFISQKKIVVIRAGGAFAETGLALLQSLVIRTALMLPHQARYTLLDPSGAGRAFPMRRYLPNVRENSGDVFRDLEEVVRETQRIIETYLDASVTSFEQVPQNMRVNEVYNLVFAANFPKGFDRRAIEALLKIGNTGHEAGIYLFIHYNPDYELPRDMDFKQFERLYVFQVEGSQTSISDRLMLHVDAVPSAELQQQVFQKLKESKPPERIIQWHELEGVETSPEAWWQEDATEFIETQIGVHGSSAKLTLWFGAKDGRPCAHGVLGAMTGSGKSNLYHVMIAGFATRYSPEELHLYLIDGKDGVEFQPYRNLPHAEVVSLRSSPELSRSVLAELIAEKERRNDLFAESGVKDFTEYRQKGQPLGNLPRILLLVDEYQELFEGDRDGIASDMLLQLAAQGRSAGIHMFLGSQHFGAANMMHRQKIFGNFHLRAAMQMSSDDITALTEFGRKGKAIIASTCNMPGKIVINDRSGDDSANVAGKVAYLTTEERDELIQKLTSKATESQIELPSRIVFDGKRQPSILENPQFQALLHLSDWPDPQEMALMARKPLWRNGFAIPDWFAGEHPFIVWLGQDYSVRGQARAIIRRNVSENLMIVGNAHTECYGMQAGILASLAVNAAPERIRFVIFDGGIPETPWGETLEKVVEGLLKPTSFPVTFSREHEDVEEMLATLEREIERRKALPSKKQTRQPEIFFVGSELNRVAQLRQRMGAYGMEPSPLAEKFANIFAEGPPLGVHCVLNFPNVATMGSVVDLRRGLIHFKHRVATQMSEDASHTFVRSREAARLQQEGPLPVNALYFNVDADSALRFKPYSIKPQSGMPTFDEQLRHLAARLSPRRPFS